MTEINYITIIFKLIDRACELNKTHGAKYYASGGTQAAFKEVETTQQLNVEATLGYDGLDSSEYVHITMKPNGDIILHKISRLNSEIKIENPENEDQVVDRAFAMLHEILEQ